MQIARVTAVTFILAAAVALGACGRKGDPEYPQGTPMVALRRQAAQIKEFYGIDIALTVAGELDMSDRLAAEVFQIVNEGMSNIRKHSDARRGFIQLTCAKGTLAIRIDNECLDGPVGAFTPNSMAERAAALGGRAEVVQTASGITSVQIEIPI